MIDIQTLTIGSHILYKGEQVEVFDMDYYSIGHSGSNISHNAECFDPIPITEELLKELGFVPTYDEGIELWNKQIIPKECNNPLTSKYGVNLRVYRYCNGWQVETNPSNGLRVNYLHEMELIVYLTTKKELI